MAYPEVKGTALCCPSATGSFFQGSPCLALAAAVAAWSCVMAVRVNHRRNIVAAHAASPECLRELLATANLNFMYGVDSVDGDLTNTEMHRGIVSDARLLLRVRPVKPRTLQCRQCGRFVHVTVSRQRTGDCICCGRRHPKADLCKPHSVNCGRAHFATNPTCPMWQEEQRVTTFMATTPTLLSRCSVRVAVHKERHEVLSYAAALKASPPPSSKAPGHPRTAPAPRYQNQPTASSTEVELPAVHPFTPAEDERDANIRIFVTTLHYVLDYLPQDHSARELRTIAANPPPGVLRRE
ncbi:hypothetical protein MRX96_057620 [Rhipicephalus microplus]